jgi:hypothetical protein
MAMRRFALAVLLLCVLPAGPASSQTKPAARYRVPQPFTPPKPALRPVQAAPTAPTITLAPVGQPAAVSGSAALISSAMADVCRAQAARRYYICLSGDVSDDSCPSDWARGRSQCGSLRLRP